MAFAGQQEELENLRQRIAVVQQNMDKTSESKNEAADALRESERAISTSNRKRRRNLSTATCLRTKNPQTTGTTTQIKYQHG